MDEIVYQLPHAVIMSKISLIRHGDARYENTAHEKSFDTVGDLKPESIGKLRLQAQEFVRKLEKDERVTIWSSPIPRAIETANIFAEELDAEDMDIRKKKLFPVFEEARGFRWEYLRAMVLWGEVSVGGVPISLDVSVTNPDGLNFTQYFRQSAWKKIPSGYIEKLGEAGKTLQGIETFSSITKRIFREIERIAKASIGTKNHILIFTHQCNMDFLTELVNEYRNGGVLTGENITLEKTGAEFDIIDFPQESDEADTKNVIERTRAKFEDILRA